MTQELDKHTLLKERARMLAARGSQAAARQLYDHVVTIEVGGQRYGIALTQLREIARAAPIAPLPGLPGFMLGVCSVRGDLHCVIDLGVLRGSAHAGSANFFALVEVAERSLAIACDDIIGIHEVHSDELAPNLLTDAARTAFTRAITRENVHILDVERLLQDERLSIRQLANHSLGHGAAQP